MLYVAVGSHRAKTSFVRILNRVVREIHLSFEALSIPVCRYLHCSPDRAAASIYPVPFKQPGIRVKFGGAD